MYSKTVVVSNELGLHARPASIFVIQAKKFKSEITIQMDDKTLNAKSMAAILGACIDKGTELRLTANGEDEQEAVDSLITTIKNNLE